ncbi:hypothetical protein [Embleya sp. AB8]|uniref:hypothetical protein n=1 Tax=Embleya sp. AB8 TaxID=3156304 RepID=UPI003C74828D
MDPDQRPAPVVQLFAHHDRLCPECGAQTLTVVVAEITLGAETRDAGGWAHCTACDAMPHPTMEVPDGR